MSTDDRSPLDQALMALSRWTARSYWSRLSVRPEDVVEARSVGPTQVVLRTTYEQRGVRYQLRPASRRPHEEDPAPKAWSFELTFPDGARLGAEIVHDVATDLHHDCGVCSATGQMNCPTCNGDGTIRRGKSTVTCPRCAGHTAIECESCQGSGGVFARPAVWARLEEAEVVRVREAEELPIDVLLDLQEASDGDLIHEQRAPHITSLNTADSEEPSEVARFDDLVQELLAEPDLPKGARAREQHLEIRRVPAFAVTFRGGGEVFVYGEPPKARPEARLRSPLYQVARVAPFVGGVVVLAAVAWALN